MAPHLFAVRVSDGRLDIAIDGAQVKRGDRVHFPLEEFLEAEFFSCTEEGTGGRGTYSHEPTGGSINLHSTPGMGDVVARLASGRTLRVECKKGPLAASKRLLAASLPEPTWLPQAPPRLRVA